MKTITKIFLFFLSIVSLFKTQAQNNDTQIIRDVGYFYNSMETDFGLDYIEGAIKIRVYKHGDFLQLGYNSGTVKIGSSYFYKGKKYHDSEIPEIANIKVKSVSGTLIIRKGGSYFDSKEITVYFDKFLDNSGSLGGNNVTLKEGITSDWYHENIAQGMLSFEFNVNSITCDKTEGANARIERNIKTEKDKIAATEKAEKENSKNKSTSTNTTSSSDDFWNDKTTVASTDSERGGDNKEAYKEYERRKEAEEKKARQEKETIDRVNKIMEDSERDRKERERKVEIWTNNLYSTFYAAQAASEARGRLNENSSLSGNYESVEDLEAEFNQKYYSISQDVQEMKDAENEGIQQGANLLFNDGSVSGQATGELVGLLGSVINSSSAEKEARERRESLERKRAEELKILNQKKWNAILELRAKLFTQFADGGTPLSKHNIQQPEVYCFVYTIDPATLQQTEPNLYISNVFALAQYNDGTWPFKNTLVADIKKKTKTNGVILMGYYTQQKMAEQMRNGLINLAPKAQIKTLAIEYKGSQPQTANQTNNIDFWETGTSTKKEDTQENTQKTKKQDDFWNN